MPGQSDAITEMRKACRHRTVVVLRIGRLGFSAGKILEKHYAKFGKVDYVYVPPKVKQEYAGESVLESHHLRPSDLGFVVMSTESEAQNIVAAGEEQLVSGKMIKVRPHV